MSAPLSQRLREETSDAHTAAERSPFMQALMRGTLERAAYGRFVRDLHALYTTMETAHEAHRAHPALAPLRFAELTRAAHLARDAEFFNGPAWREQRPSGAAVACVAHLEGIVASEPERLVAHLYVRYLGDLSGGQILKRVAAKTLALDGSRGLEFYAFDAIPDPTAFKNAYRAALDALPLDDAARDRVVEEAKAAFTFSQRIADAALEPVAAH